MRVKSRIHGNLHRDNIEMMLHRMLEDSRSNALTLINPCLMKSLCFSLSKYDRMPQIVIELSLYSFL